MDSFRRRETGQQASPNNSGECLPRNQHDALQSEYERVARARDMLESKCRRYKEMLREWKDYYKGWIEKKGPRPTTQRKAFAVRENDSSTQIPAPPLPPINTTPTPNPHALGPTLSPDRLTIDLNDWQQQRPRSGDHFSESVERTTNTAQTNRAYLDNLTAIGSAETSGDDESKSTTVHSLQKSNGGQTFDSNCGLPRLMNEEDEDSLVIVSERYLKRKRHSKKGDSEIVINEDGNVKSEEDSSNSAIAVSSQPMDAAQDSLDLDDVGRSVDTPRKRQRLEEMRILSSRSDASNLRLSAHLHGGTEWPKGDAPDVLPKIEHKEMMRAQAFEMIPTHHSPESSVALSQTRTKDQEKLERKYLRIAEQNALDDRIHGPRILPLLRDQHPKPVWYPLSSHHRGSHIEHRPAELEDDPVILRPKDPNVPPRTSTKKGRSTTPSRRDHGGAYVPAIAEDGEGCDPSKSISCMAQTPTMVEVVRKRKPNAAIYSVASSPHHRLGALLKESTSAKTTCPLIKPNESLGKPSVSPRTPMKSYRGSSVHRVHHNFFTAPVQRSKPPQQPHAMTTPESPSRSGPFDNGPSPCNPPEILPEQEPLRVRSLDRLRLSDFTLNKNHSEYAFHESIRKHDEKKRVGGCTDPFCDRCKDIAKFAELTEFVAPTTSRLFGSSPLDTEAAEQQLLEEYLGDGKQRLKRMKTDEKNEALKRAREKSFADMYGKHRQLHNRAVSPPGYWETDFPSTQQEAENREAAKAIDKVRIKERYNEAMRGGMWKFADE